MGYIGRQDLDKFVNEELDKIKEIENSTTEKFKGFKKEINSQYEEFKKEANTIKDIKNNKKYKWGVENGLVYIEEVED